VRTPDVSLPDNHLTRADLVPRDHRYFSGRRLHGPRRPHSRRCAPDRARGDCSNSFYYRFATTGGLTHKTLVADVRELVDLAQSRQLPFLAAAIAYYAFLSVVPLLIVALTIASVVAGEALAEQIVASSASS